MKLLVGYQLREDRRFLDSILEYKDQISEVYFSWGNLPNGRNSVLHHAGFSPLEAMNRQREDLKQIAGAGISLNLLLNGNCYGRRSLSRGFFQEIGDLTDELRSSMRLRSITTASPVIAKFLRENFPDLSIRASVNLGIGTEEGVAYLSPWFDGFYARRELNRDWEGLKRFSEMLRRRGKQVYLLANSGCLNDCSARHFHDNLVAHEQEIAEMDNAFSFRGICRDYLEADDHRQELLRISNWIRPEDLARYDELADGAKLATRVSRNPEMILRAYAEGRFSGNLLQLTEPDFSALYHPMALDNSHIPQNYWEKTVRCDRNCTACGYCRDVMRRALRPLPEALLQEEPQLKEGTVAC